MFVHGSHTDGTLVSHFVPRDVDVLQELTKKTDSTVCFSVTTVDRETARRLEPGTPPPEKRPLAMSRLVDAGVALAPVVPGITDGKANIEAVVRAAADYGARFCGRARCTPSRGPKRTSSTPYAASTRRCGTSTGARTPARTRPRTCSAG